MEKCIIQQDEECTNCHSELPAGSFAHTDDEEELICEDCWNDEEEQSFGLSDVQWISEY
jgi:hypothetical protein